MILSIYPLPQITYTHDGSVTMLSEKGVAFAYEEERACRFQHAIAAVPERSAFLGLRYLGVNPDDISSLVVTSMEECSLQPGYERKIAYVKDLLHLKTDVPVHCVPHHLAHSALAVLTSSFDDCAFLTIDGGGDGIMGHWGRFHGGQFEVIESFEFSPAILYGYVASLAGFSLFEEGKVMGLSSYGTCNALLYDWLKSHFSIRPGSAAMEVSPAVKLKWKSSVDLNAISGDTFCRHKYFKLSVDFAAELVPEWLPDLSAIEIASTGQFFFEELMATAIGNVVRTAKTKNIALAGGAFQNVVFNGKLREMVDCNPHIPIAPNDSGLSLGAGLLAWNQQTRRRPHFPVSPYLGPSYDTEAVEAAISAFSLKYERPANLCERVATAIADGNVVGWFQGRAELGPRALGARSVLADPRDPLAKARLNELLKKRDWFMPYAPSILEEHGAEYFEHFVPSPYMNHAFTVRTEKRSCIPSAIHVDGSCRAHTVSSKANPLYHQLLVSFYEMTGVPLLLNTSFNRHGLPMVMTPRQALQHLLEGNFDILAIEECLVFREIVKSEKATFRDDEYHLAKANLKHAAGLLKRGRARKAQEALVGLPISVCVESHGFTFYGGCVWRIDESECELERWFESEWIKLKKR